MQTAEQENRQNAGANPHCVVHVRDLQMLLLMALNSARDHVELSDYSAQLFERYAKRATRDDSVFMKSIRDMAEREALLFKAMGRTEYLGCMTRITTALEKCS